MALWNADLFQKMSQQIEEVALSQKSKYAVKAIMQYSDILQEIALAARGGWKPFLEQLDKAAADAEAAYKQGLDAVKREFPQWTRIISLAETADAFLIQRIRFFDIVDCLGGYLERELERPEYSGIATMADMLEPLPDDPTKSWFGIVINAAASTMEQADPDKYRKYQEMIRGAAEDEEPEPQGVGNLPRVMGRPPATLALPLDKITSNWLWLTDALTEESGQLLFATEKKGSKNEATIIFGMCFDELIGSESVKINRELSSFDKRVYIACDSIYQKHGSKMSIGQIYTAIGNTGKPSANQLKKIDDSLTKMGMARIYIDNSNEIKVNKKYPLYIHDEPLLSFKRDRLFINGNLANNSIEILAELPLMKFARERGQITTIPRKLLESPVSKTEFNLAIDDYLQLRISRMKGKGNSSRKILYTTLYEKCKITDKKQMQRTPERVRRYLDYYKEIGWIKGYKEEPKAVTIIL